GRAAHRRQRDRGTARRDRRDRDDDGGADVPVVRRPPAPRRASLVSHGRGGHALPGLPGRRRRDRHPGAAVRSRVAGNLRAGAPGAIGV
ncbi:MAG: hypothetical protein AVDCRST_MAG69-2783, partial [uncultured Solirubrobacteraceae bacterium]